ncbi:MAG: tetratricopeptide repeat protein [Candidatus Nitrosotenuis sp.]
MKKFDINEFRAGDWYQLGESLENQKKRFKCFKKAVALDPLYGPAWHFLGVLFTENGDTKKAMFCNTKAVEAYKTGLQRYRRQITKDEWDVQNKINPEKEKNTQPKVPYDFIAVVDGKIDLILENLGRLYWNMNEYEKSADCYDKLIDEYPNWSKYHASRGMAYHFMKEHEKAIDDLRFAVEVEDTDYESYFYLAQSYKALEKYDRAEWYFNKAKNAAEKFPTDVKANAIMGDASFEIDELDECIKVYKDILKKSPENTVVLSKLAEAHLVCGHHKKAKRCFEKICKIKESQNQVKGVE